MFKLKVFGNPYLTHLTDTRQYRFETALPVLIAAYISVEHQGEVKREVVYDLFFPMTPIYPQHGSESGRIIYEQLWKRVKEAKNLGSISIQQIELGIPSESEIKFACQELKKYQVIEHHQLKEKSLECWLTKSFKDYLKSFWDEKSGLLFSDKDKERNIRKTCFQNISCIREFIKDFVSNEEQLAKMVPTGVRGKKGQPFVIHIDCDSTELMGALKKRDFEQIQTIYRGNFLEDIEDNLRSTVWLPPVLCEWIYNQRQGFTHHVSQTLVSIIQDLKQQAEEQRIALLQSIQAFCQDRGLLDNGDLKHAIDIHLLPNNRDTTLLAKPDTHISESTLPKSVGYDSPFSSNRQHLLAKMKEVCDFQLKAIQRQIDTHLAIETLKCPATASFPVQERQRFLQVLFGQSYGFMVVVGEAGMGKSWFLYHITQQLIEDAKGDENKPLPLLFHLADWTLQSLSFEKWLKLELIQLGLAEKDIDSDFDGLLARKQCVFLLDGFDNLPPTQRLNRLKTINSFIQKHGESRLGGIIMASRPDEYDAAKQELLEEKPLITFHFHAEATLQALSVEEGCSYITEQSSQLPLDILLQSDAFRQFLITPLGLTLLIESSKSQQIAEKTETNFDTAKNTLISNYIHNCFKRVAESYHKKRQPLPYTAQEVTTWLGHIARSMHIGSAFSVEGLSPERILTDKQRYYYQWGFTLLFGLIFGAMMGGVSGLIFGGKQISDYAKEEVVLPDILMGTYQILTDWSKSSALIDKIQLIISYASIGIVSAVLMSSLTFLLFKHIRFSIFLSGYLSLSLGFTGLLTEGARWAVFVIIFYGTLGFLVGWLVEDKYTDSLIIELHKDTRLSYERFFKQKQDLVWSGLFIFISALLMSIFSIFLPKLTLGVALLQGIAIGVTFTLAYIFYRLKTQIDWQEKDFLPRQKIKVALKRSVFMMFFIGGLITFLIVGLGAYHLGWPGNLSFGLRSGMPVGITIGFMLYGGTEVLKHLTLRLVMYQYDIAPWHYSRFLEYAKLLTFLKPQSSGYAFRHDWFQEHFQQLRCV